MPPKYQVICLDGETVTARHSPRSPLHCDGRQRGMTARRPPSTTWSCWESRAKSSRPWATSRLWGPQVWTRSSSSWSVSAIGGPRAASHAPGEREVSEILPEKPRIFGFSFCIGRLQRACPVQPIQWYAKPKSVKPGESNSKPLLGHRKRRR